LPAPIEKLGFVYAFPGWDTPPVGGFEQVLVRGRFSGWKGFELFGEHFGCKPYHEFPERSAFFSGPPI
jgi:hypothetical protein